MNHLGRKDTFWAHSHLRFIVRLPLPLGSRMGCADTHPPRSTHYPGAHIPQKQTPPTGADPPEQTPPQQSMLGDTVNVRVVCIPLECNLVVIVIPIHPKTIVKAFA